MDVPRIVIELADDIASTLARDEQHDKESLRDISTTFAGGKRLSRLSALLNHPDHAEVLATRLVDDDPQPDDPANPRLRVQRRLECEIREQCNLPVPTLLGLFVLDLPGFDEEKADALLDRLRELIQPDPVTKQPPELETAYYDEEIGLAHGNGLRGGGFADQPYLTKLGINLPVMRRGAAAARWARYDGTGVQFIHIEEGWNVTHEAFNDDVRAQDPGTAFDVDQIVHGNAALGIVLANGAKSKICGIARNCTLKGLYALKSEGGRPHERLEKGIGLAASILAAGDVILLALQVKDTLLPVEVKPGVFKAIRAATSKGIIVIEAAGNQGRPLEDALGNPRRAAAWTDQKNVPIFQGFPDSGAIIVGGCTVPNNGAQYDPPVQDDDTRCGPRVDCCAWSRDVWTSHGEPSDYNYFNGTSAAAPAIAGLALIIQQYAKERLGGPLTPVHMRELFRDPTCGTAVDHTCPGSSISMPDAMKLFERLEESSS